MNNMKEQYLRKILETQKFYQHMHCQSVLICYLETDRYTKYIKGMQNLQVQMVSCWKDLMNKITPVMKTQDRHIKRTVNIKKKGQNMQNNESKGSSVMAVLSVGLTRFSTDGKIHTTYGRNRISLMKKGFNSKQIKENKT